jgi:hypothetical protein
LAAEFQQKIITKAASKFFSQTYPPPPSRVVLVKRKQIPPRTNFMATRMRSPSQFENRDINFELENNFINSTKEYKYYMDMHNTVSLILYYYFNPPMTLTLKVK